MNHNAGNGKPADSGSMEKKVASGRCMMGFVAIPFFTAAFGVALMALTYFLVADTSDSKSAVEYLKIIKEKRGNACWRAAFQLSRMLTLTHESADDKTFIREILDVFNDESIYANDPRIRWFLALAMGRTGHAGFCEPLIHKLEEAERVEEIAVFAKALGFLSDERAVNHLHRLLEHNDVRVRHEAVQALGNIGCADSVAKLRTMLQDAEPNVQWDTAISLAKMKDPSGRELLLKLLDREYYNNFPEIRTKGRLWAMETALRAAALLNDAELDRAIQELADSGPDIKVRTAALDVTGKFRM